MNRTLISNFRRRNDAFEALEDLYKEFLATFKRRTNVEIFYGELWRPDDRFPDYYLVAYHEPDAIAEVEWMKQYIESK